MPVNRICLLGFSKTSEDLIKSIFKDLPSSTTPIIWANANDKNLTGVIINALFLDTPQIQKYLKHVHTPVISAYSNDSGQEVALEHENFPSLDLRTPSSELTIHWINALFRQENNKNPVTNTHTERQSQARKSTSWSTSYLELINCIQHKDNVVIEAKHDDYKTWIQPSKGLVFINYPRETVPGIDSWKWRFIKEVDIPNSVRRLKIELWFFETLWQSNLALENEIASNVFYQMDRWPQPLGKERRSQALRLAAFAQKSPVNLDLLAQNTGYDADLIRCFLFAAKSAGLLHEVSLDTLKTETEVLKTAQNKSTDNQQKRSLLSRFRQKLGI